MLSRLKSLTQYFGESSCLGFRPTPKRQGEMEGEGVYFSHFSNSFCLIQAMISPLADLELPRIICKVNQDTMNFYKCPIMTTWCALRCRVMTDAKCQPQCHLYQVCITLSVFSALSVCAERHIQAEKGSIY